MCSAVHDGRRSSARRTSGALTLTTIWRSKSSPALKSRYSCVGRAKQYWQRWRHPLYVLTVQPNGSRDAPGTRFRTDFAWISWKRAPSASGASNVRVTASASPGSWASRCRASSWSCHRIRTHVRRRGGRNRCSLPQTRKQRRFAAERLRRRTGDLDRDDLARRAETGEVDDLVVADPAAQPRRVVARGALDQHVERPPHEPLCALARAALDHLDQALHALDGDLVRQELVGERRRLGA